MKRVVWVTAVCGSFCAAATFGAVNNPIDSLSRDVRSGDAKARLTAALALFDLGPAAKDAIPALSDAVYAPQPEVRLVAVAALSRMGADAKDASAALASRLDDADPEVRATAIAALEGLGQFATPALAQSHENGSSLARKNAGALLEMVEDEFQPRVPVLVNELREEDWSTQATRARGRLEHLSVIELTRILRSGEDDTTRYHAVSALGRKGAEARPALSDLAAIVRQPEEAHAMRIIAAWSLGQMGPAAKGAEGVLLSALETDPYFAVRAHCAQSIGKIGCDSPAAVEALIRSLADENATLRGACAISLWRIGEKATPAAAALTAMLEAERADKIEKYFAAAALGAIGRDAAPAVAQLTALLSDNYPDLRGAAAFALGRIGTPAKSAIPELRKASTMTSEKPDERAVAASKAAAHALARLERQERASIQ